MHYARRTISTDEGACFIMGWPRANDKRSDSGRLPKTGDFGIFHGDARLPETPARAKIKPSGNSRRAFQRGISGRLALVVTHLARVRPGTQERAARSPRRGRYSRFAGGGVVWKMPSTRSSTRASSNSAGESLDCDHTLTPIADTAAGGAGAGDRACSRSILLCKTSRMPVNAARSPVNGTDHAREWAGHRRGLRTAVTAVCCLRAQGCRPPVREQVAPRRMAGGPHARRRIVPSRAR